MIINDEFYKSVIDDIPKLMKKYSAPGLAVAFIDNSKLSNMGVFGYSDVENKKLIDYNSVFQVASISKTLTAWGIMKLMQNGKLSLDDQVDKYLISWSLPKSIYSDGVTIRRILNHTSGLSVHGYKGQLINKEEYSLVDSLNGNKNKKQKVSIINEPGKTAIYSGGGYTLLQLLIEDVTKMGFSEYMREEILLPLGMENSTFDYMNCKDNNLSKCYGYFGDMVPNYIFTEKAAAGLYTTIDDMTKFIMGTLKGIDNNESILISENITLMQSRVKREIPYGLGYHLIYLPKGRVVMNHGINRGWRSRFMILPSTKDAIIIMTNSDSGGNLVKEISLKWLEWKFGDISGFYKKKLYLTKSNRYFDIIKTYLEYIS